MILKFDLYIRLDRDIEAYWDVNSHPKEFLHLVIAVSLLA